MSRRPDVVLAAVSSRRRPAPCCLTASAGWRRPARSGGRWCVGDAHGVQRRAGTMGGHQPRGLADVRSGDTGDLFRPGVYLATMACSPRPSLRWATKAWSYSSSARGRGHSGGDIRAGAVRRCSVAKSVSGIRRSATISGAALLTAWRRMPITGWFGVLGRSQVALGVLGDIVDRVRHRPSKRSDQTGHSAACQSRAQ